MTARIRNTALASLLLVLMAVACGNPAPAQTPTVTPTQTPIPTATPDIEATVEAKGKEE